MSRPIKFRFWSTVLGKFVVPDDSIFVGALNDPRMAVTQYTGLKDKNGMEIYEGDILRVTTGNLDTGGIGKVVWFESGCNFAVTGVRNKPHHHGLPDMCQEGCMHHQLIKALVYEVIGNIYENPDLLDHQRPDVS